MNDGTLPKRRGRALAIALALAGLAATGVAQSPAPTPATTSAPTPTRPTAPTETWQAFEGTWSAAGHRQTVAVEDGGTAAIVEMSGAVVLMRGGGLSRGFSAEAIGFDDGQGLSVGRCVWTDAEGDRLFSRLRGEPLQTGKRFVGTITGGTGRYAGLEGEYAFTWQFVVPSEDGRIQGRTVSLEGRVRQAGAAER